MSCNGNYGNNGNVAGAYGNGGFWGCGGYSNNNHNNNHNNNNNSVAGANDLTPFIRQLSPGTRVTVQYDCQPPVCGTFQGFQNGFVLIDNFDGFPGLTRLLPSRINAISPSGGGHHCC